MNSTEIKGNWNELKGNLKQKYADLTEDDLLYAEGKEDEMCGKEEQFKEIEKYLNGEGTEEEKTEFFKDKEDLKKFCKSQLQERQVLLRFGSYFTK